MDTINPFEHTPEEIAACAFALDHDLACEENVRYQRDALELDDDHEGLAYAIANPFSFLCVGLGFTEARALYDQAVELYAEFLSF